MYIHVSYRDTAWNGHPTGWQAQRLSGMHLAEGCATAAEAVRVAREALDDQQEG